MMDFKKELKSIGVILTEEKELQFEKYYNRLVEVNSYMNLTSITEKDEVYNKHFLDSLSILKAYNFSDVKTLCDVGSGAGFPSIPLAIENKDISVTIIDALNKRIKFLNSLVSELGLSNVEAYHQRAEEYVKEKREYFDATTARAVARLNVLAELCLPLTKVGGVFIAMKGQEQAEIEEAKNAITILGGKIESIVEFYLPDDAGKRTIIVIRKVKETPEKYPRAFGRIKEKPL